VFELVLRIMRLGIVIMAKRDTHNDSNVDNSRNPLSIVVGTRFV
jgi:hypothetical protein